MNQDNLKGFDPAFFEKIDENTRDTVVLKMVTRLIDELDDEGLAKLKELEDDSDALGAFFEEKFGKEYLMIVAREEWEALKDRIEARVEDLATGRNSFASAAASMLNDEDASLD